MTRKQAVGGGHTHTSHYNGLCQKPKTKNILIWKFKSLSPNLSRQNFMPLNENQSIIEQSNVILITKIIWTKISLWVTELDFCTRCLLQRTCEYSHIFRPLDHLPRQTVAFKNRCITSIFFLVHARCVVSCSPLHVGGIWGKKQTSQDDKDRSRGKKKSLSIEQGWGMLYGGTLLANLTMETAMTHTAQPLHKAKETTAQHNVEVWCSTD